MKRDLASIIAAASCAVLLTACNSLWPSIRVQSDGLGNTPLGRKLQVIWMSGDKQLNDQIKRLLAQQDGTPRERAEAIGMQCDPLPSRRCHYEGFVLHEFTGPICARSMVAAMAKASWEMPRSARSRATVCPNAFAIVGSKVVVPLGRPRGIGGTVRRRLPALR